MPFAFDTAQQVQIEVLFQQGELNGRYSPMYAYINGLLNTGNPPPTVDIEVKKSQLWMSGAAQANSGVGPYAVVIREYTQNQQRLHLGRPAPGGSGINPPKLRNKPQKLNISLDIVKKMSVRQ